MKLEIQITDSIHYHENARIDGDSAILPYNYYRLEVYGKLKINDREYEINWQRDNDYYSEENNATRNELAIYGEGSDELIEKIIKLDEKWIENLSVEDKEFMEIHYLCSDIKNTDDLFMVYQALMESTPTPQDYCKIYGR